jgi:hypothetical protein
VAVTTSMVIRLGSGDIREMVHDFLKKKGEPVALVLDEMDHHRTTFSLRVTEGDRPGEQTIYEAVVTHFARGDGGKGL